MDDEGYPPDPLECLAYWTLRGDGASVEVLWCSTHLRVLPLSRAAWTSLYFLPLPAQGQIEDMCEATGG